MIVIYLFLVLVAFLVNSITIVPFINLLYQLRFLRRKQKTRDFLNRRTPIFDRFHKNKAGTPVGGGLLLVGVLSLLYFIFYPILQLAGIYIKTAYPVSDELHVLFFTFLSFALLGLYDDLHKFFGFEKTGFFGLRMRHKFILQWILATIVAGLLYFNLKIDFIYFPFFGPIRLGIGIIPVAAFLIVAFANAYNITDGLDGLSSGLLLICLFAFWIIAYSSLDTPLSVFLALWIGGLLAFLYFNVWPARIFLGDVGALSFGATLALVGLLLGKIIPLAVIGGLFVVEALSSLLQISWKAIFGKKLFPVAPFHLWLQLRGWPEPKIVARAWLAGVVLALVGLLLAFV